MARGVLGIGHTLTLLVAGTLLVVLRADMPAMASDVLACAVVLLLVGFGFRAIDLSAGQASAGRTHSHVHGAASGSPPGPMDASPATAARRRSPRSGGQRRAHRAGHGDDPVDGVALIYLVLFGVGSTVGMAALSGLMGWPIARVGAHGAVARCVSLAVGCISIMLGLYWGYPLIGRLL